MNRNSMPNSRETEDHYQQQGEQAYTTAGEEHAQQERESRNTLRVWRKRVHVVGTHEMLEPKTMIRGALGQDGSHAGLLRRVGRAGCRDEHLSWTRRLTIRAA